ncbi:MAG: hypothetical protein CMO55_12010 [Verrucomicrobiales bacterium]|nr:hypothetical protein [Verrucomicrobiales bacterium]
MITRKQAISIVAEHWNKSILQDGDEFHPSSVELPEECDFWVIHGNSKAYLVDGDHQRLAVGEGGYVVDADTGALEIAGSAQDVLDILQDCRDDKVANGKNYVLAGGTGSRAFHEISAFRKVFACGVHRAREMLKAPERYWFTGKRRLLVSYQAEFEALDIPSEVILLDDVSDVITINWSSRFKWDLQSLSNRIQSVQSDKAK